MRRVDPPAAGPQRARPGVGLSWTQALDDWLAGAPGGIDWVEFEPQTTWLVAAPGAPPRAPRAVLQHLQRLPGRKLVHSVAAPVGGGPRPDAQQLALLREAVQALGAPYLSEHLSFNAAHGVCTGFFMPPRQTQAQVRVVADHIRRLQDAVGVPVAIENGTSYLRPRSDEMSDGEFLARVAEAADCGLLLDLHNAHANAVNGRQPLAELLAMLPLQRVWELHLAGGMLRDGFWLDAHSGPVPSALWPPLKGLPARLPALQAAVFEIFPSFVDGIGTAAVAAELQRLRAWLDGGDPGEGAGDEPAPGHAPPLTWVDSEAAAAAPDDGRGWEAALTSLVTGQPLAADDDTASRWRARLAPEPGLGLVRDLVFSFRASMVVQVLPLSTRLILANVGPAALRLMLQDCFAHHPPQLYATLEAQAFATQVQARGLRLPYLADVLAYELALTQTLVDGRARVVSFAFEPVPLLRALSEGRLPDEVPQPGCFEVELLPDDATAP
jgi:uncharacterized protein (UPF0276 family)